MVSIRDMLFSSSGTPRNECPVSSNNDTEIECRPDNENTNDFSMPGALSPRIVLAVVAMSFPMILSITRSKKIIEGLRPLALVKVCTSINLSVMFLTEVTQKWNLSSGLVNLDLTETISNLVMAILCGITAVITMRERRAVSFGKYFCLVTFWVVMLISASLAIYSNSLPDILSLKNTDVLMDIVRFLGVFFAFFLSLFSTKNSSRVGRPLPAKSTYVHPQEKSSFLGNFVFDWAFPLVWTGYKRRLEESDVPELSVSDRCYNVLTQFELQWKQEEYRCKLINESQSMQVENIKDAPLGEYQMTENEINVEKCSVFKVLCQTYGFRFIFQQSLKTVLELSGFVDPLLSAILMNNIQNKHNESVWNGVLIVTAIFLIQSFFEAAHHRLWLTMARLCRHQSASLMMTIFKKSLTLQNDCMKDKTKGEIINLVSGDCDKIARTTQHAFVLPITPIKIGLGMYILYRYLGWSMLGGVAIVIVLVPLNIYLGRRSSKSVIEGNKVKDKRVKLMNEIVNGIKVIKLYAWEKSFIDKVNNIRSEEMDYNYRRCFDHASIDGMFRAIPFFVSAFTFGIFLMQGGHLDVATGFVTVSLFSLLSHPLNHLLLFLPGCMDSMDSLNRINDFLNGKDISSDIIDRSSEGPSAVRIKGGNFSWNDRNCEATLKNINVDIPKGSLVAVVGMVGSGKSSLLSSMLGEMQKLDGKVEIQGRVAYVPQEAWILNATLQNNVLFGSALDQQHYDSVINNCSLRNDIKIMPAGDKTEIGEKGVNLSGGQKQRTSLARAVYNDADVYLLDDPLSAVDAHVGKHIFNKVISHQGSLKGKTRILVTHGIQWLPKVDSIIVMKNGQISDTGTYEELTSRDGTFAQFLQEVCSKSFDDENNKTKSLKQNIFKRLQSQDGKQKVNSVSLNEVSQKENEAKFSSDDTTSDEDGDGFVSDSDTNTEANGKCIEEEELEQGDVKRAVYLEFLKAIGLRYVFLCILVFFVSFIADKYSNYTINRWSEDPLLANKSLSLTQEYQDRSHYYLYSYALSGFVHVVTTFVFIVMTMKGGYKASSKIHDNLLLSIMKCPMSFFDTTPSGRVITRFSTDVSSVDNLGIFFRLVIEHIIVIIACLIAIIIYIPAIVVYLIPITGLYYFFYRVHITTTRQLRRYNSKYKSPISVHFSEALGGVSSIRAYNSQRKFITTMETKIEEWFKFNLTELSVGLWVAVRLAFLYLLVKFCASLIIVFDNTISAGTASLVLIFAGEFSGYLRGLVHIVTGMETEVVSLERVIKYTNEPPEAPWEIPEAKPSVEWPRDGRLVLDNLKARYRNGLDLVLKGVSCNIKKGEKIGIVGRTGAGKSSVTMALFRLIEANSGCIKVDNERISNMGLHDLRSKITILPQEPIIFAGTLRMNLDPFDNCTTEELWKALEHSHLKSFVEGLPCHLDFECEEGGKNLSVGQRQLLCLARTLLRQTRILVLDEATAAVDMETDELIQKTIRTVFKECTVLAIAHRLNTIMDYDRILVLDQGLVKEFDSPNNLLADKQSIFYGMAKDAKLVS